MGANLKRFYLVKNYYLCEVVKKPIHIGQQTSNSRCKKGHNIMNIYYITMIAMAVLAIVVFVALFYFKAGYGYLTSNKWGPAIPNKIAWILMEAPAFLFLLYYTLKFALVGAGQGLSWSDSVNGNRLSVLYVMAGLFLLHYFQRSFIFPLLMRGKSKTPIAIMVMGMLFNTINSFLIAGWIFGIPGLLDAQAPEGYYTIEWFKNPKFIIGTIIFIAGMMININSDHIIRNLRKPGDTKHYIPKKGFYKYVTSANYFGELVEWIGYAILTWSPAGLLFAIWTFANLGPRAKSLSEKYVEEFGEEYTELNKKHLIPYIW